MEIIIYFLNGNSEKIQLHYLEKEYRSDVCVNIKGLFYEVYFFTIESLNYEMTKDGFFTLPGIIILDKITNEFIISSIKLLAKIGFFEELKGYGQLPLRRGFANKWYRNEITFYEKDVEKCSVFIK